MSENDELLAWLVRDGVVRSPSARVIPLTGGVSSEICRVEDGAETFVVKRALGKLKVKGEWLADTSRNQCEQRFLQWCHEQIPGSVPTILYCGENYFTMEWLGEGFRNWKEMLIERKSSPVIAERAGRLLGRIHRLSYLNADLRDQFNRDDLFEQLRIVPYLLATGKKHPALLQLIEEGIRALRGHRECLIHGDFSPKNILIQDDRLVILDAEVAVFGDPAFDLAFFLNHLCLKGLYHAPNLETEELQAKAAIAGYFEERQLDETDRRALDARTAFILPMLMLARVDGFSPVEYLNRVEQERLRVFVRRPIREPLFLEALVEDWFNHLR